jgi:predicted dehydrogenase
MIGLHHQHPRLYFPLWSNLPAYRPLAVAEADEAFLAREKDFFRLDACNDYRRILDRKDIDVVIVWLPHSQMPQAVEDAAAAGKHVIVEKPCAADVAGARRIVEVSRKYPGIKISAPYCWRTHPATGHIRAVVDAGALGAITAMEGRLNAGGAWRYVRDNAPWMLRSAEGGGPMWNLGVHWIDYFRWLTGQEVASVCGAVSGPLGDPPRDIEDNAQAVLKFNGGAVAVLDISYGLTENHPGKRDIYVSLRGQRGNIQWTPAWQGVKDEVLIVGEDPPAAQARPRRVEVASRTIPGYCGHMAWAWLSDFASAVNEDRQPVVKPADILAAIEAADAFYRSVRNGKTESLQKA